MANFSFIFTIILLICALVTFRSSDYYKQKFESGFIANEEKVTGDAKEKHLKLLKRYLFVYLLATLSDWLQGPYVYALYMEYGFEQHEIAELFVAGFGSSMIFGSFIGGMADWGGRRTFVIIFALVYGASCITKREYFNYIYNYFEFDSAHSFFCRFQELWNSYAWALARWSCNFLII